MNGRLISFFFCVCVFFAVLFSLHADIALKSNSKSEKKICSQHENILFKRRLNQNLTRLLYLFSFSLWMTSVIAALCHSSFSLSLFFFFLYVFSLGWNVFVFVTGNTPNQNNITVAIDGSGGVLNVRTISFGKFLGCHYGKAACTRYFMRYSIVSNISTEIYYFFRYKRRVIERVKGNERESVWYVISV